MMSVFVPEPNIQLQQVRFRLFYLGGNMKYVFQKILFILALTIAGFTFGMLLFFDLVEKEKIMAVLIILGSIITAIALWLEMRKHNLKLD